MTKPFQDLIWGAIKTVSEKNTLGIVLDKSNNISVIFLDKRYDYTDKVLDLLLKNSPEKKIEKGTPNKRNINDSRDEKMRIMKDQQRESKDVKAKKIETINKSTIN